MEEKIIDFGAFLKELHSSSSDDVSAIEEHLKTESLIISDADETYEAGYNNAVEYIQKEFESALDKEDEEFNGMTVNDALDEIESWDFVEAFGDDAERLSDAIKRIYRFFGRV